jgi:hypothetical protein
MAPVHTEETRVKARGYWESGMHPTQVQEALKLNYGAKVPLRTLGNWSEKYDWKPWRAAQQEKLSTVNPNLPFGVTNIQDPIMHLAIVQAKKWLKVRASQSQLDEQAESLSLQSPSSLIRQCLEEIDNDYAIGVRGIEYLRCSVLPQYIRQLKHLKDNQKDIPRADIPFAGSAYDSSSRFDTTPQAHGMENVSLSDPTMDFPAQEPASGSVLSEDEIREGMRELAEHRLEVDAMKMEISENGVDFEESDWEDIDFDEPDIRDLLNEQISLSRAILEELQKLNKDKEDDDEAKWNPYKWPNNDGLP